VHGGVAATVLDECLARPAIMAFEAGTGVTANLEIKYMKPAVSGAFYVVRSKVDRVERNKCWVHGTLEDLHGRHCVEAKGLYVVPKGLYEVPTGMKLQNIKGKF
jgi:acyl-coenzyme A thioesterase PaaI-like protein